MGQRYVFRGGQLTPVGSKPYKRFSALRTPQSEPIPGSSQVENSAGGYVYKVDQWKRLERFLVLGTEGGTYYVGERELTKDNALNVLRCIKDDGPRTVRIISEISQAGRAPKNDPALFALALASGVGDMATRKAAYGDLPYVARTGTHLFRFMGYRKQFGGFGRGMRTALGRWYLDKPTDKLAYHLVKYRQREGWTHADVLRLAHPKPINLAQDALLAFAAHPDQWGAASSYAPVIEGYVRAQEATTPAEWTSVLAAFDLPWEALPTEALAHAEVWQALVATGNLPMTAMIRNLGRMTKNGALVAGGETTGLVIEMLRSEQAIRTSRVHPIQVLSALVTYAQGHGMRGKDSWEALPKVVDALDQAFYRSFENVTPTNKRIMLALDVSGSMTMGEVSGVPGLTPRMAAAAMAFVTAGVEPNHETMAFSDSLVPFPVSPRQRLDDVMRVMEEIPFGRTDCALPMLYAMSRKVPMEVDAFVVYTDNETWAGHIHPTQALRQYRQQTGIPAKLIVVGMTSTGFSIADPDDGGQLDVVGFDTATPNLISNFIGGTP